MEPAIQILSKQLTKALEGKLPGIISHQKMVPPGRQLKHPGKNQSLIKKSSVLILIYPENNDFFICLMKRPSTMKHHAGQVSFPGGQIEKDDQDEIQAALREAHEEIGLNPEKVGIAGTLSNLYVHVSKFDICPVVAVSAVKPDINQDSKEVEKLLFLPLLKHLSEKGFPTTKIQTSEGFFEVPCIYFENEIIWGATAMILSELFDVIKSLPFIKGSD